MEIQMRLTLSLLCGIALAPQPSWADTTGWGALLYRQYCATCHGLDARGGGPMTAVLTIAAPDLTALSARNGGTFPMLDVVGVIDGRAELLGHGGPMPVFGALLGGESAVLDGPDGTVVETSADIVALAEWLKTIQK
jgi:mono/diheme cytochrome c family protein